ncbi:hypothetical protein B7P43_G06299 [Cryptotermes secundus]|uniref:Uncharacterized protein n=1 Tax=Cryptotermes secundus TaxID=105785 RepID=A0A2J7Q7F5_9NEOP|nr:hypothetical protein B7P43_G06299 [Cryptotermes secundus]
MFERDVLPPLSGSKCKQNIACGVLGLFNPEGGVIIFLQNTGKLYESTWPHIQEDSLP